MAFLVTLLCLLYCWSSVSVAEYVIELTDDNFQETVYNQDMMVVEFYATWCAHCASLVPVFEDVARALKAHEVMVGRVNVDTEKEVQDKYQVFNLPGVRIFRRGQVFDYNGPMTKDGTQAIIEYFLKEKEKTWLVDNPIVELTDDNFDDVTGSVDLVLVDFYVEECVPCQQFEPYFSAAARALSTHAPPIMFANLNVPKNMDTAKRFWVQDYPLLLMFRHGKRYNYTGPMMDIDGIIEYMKLQAGPSSWAISSLSDAKAFVAGKTDVRAIGYFSPETDADVLKTFIESGNFAREDVKLGHTTDVSLAEYFTVNVNTVVVYHPRHLVTKYEQGFSVIPEIESESSESLVRVYQEASRPLVGEMTKANMLRAYKHRPLLVAFFEVNWNHEGIENTLYWHGLLADVAVKYHQHNLGIAFAIANEPDFPSDLRALGFSDWGEDVAVGIFAPGPLKYRMTEELTKDSLAEFVDDFLVGTLKPYFSSEKAPRKGSGPVRTVVGSTYEKIVYDPTKEVVLLVCIPSMKECVKPYRWFPLAAKQFHKKTKDVVFGQINIELNDIPLEMFKLDDLPTLLYSPKGSAGEEDLVRIPPLEDEEDLLRWLRREANLRPPKNKEEL